MIDYKSVSVCLSCTQWYTVSPYLAVAGCRHDSLIHDLQSRRPVLLPPSIKLKLISLKQTASQGIRNLLVCLFPTKVCWVTGKVVSWSLCLHLILPQSHCRESWWRTDCQLISPADSPLSYCSVLERVNSPKKSHGSQRFAKPIRMFQTV